MAYAEGSSFDEGYQEQDWMQNDTFGGGDGFSQYASHPATFFAEPDYLLPPAPSSGAFLELSGWNPTSPEAPPENIESTPPLDPSTSSSSNRDSRSPSYTEPLHFTFSGSVSSSVLDRLILS